MCSLSGTITLIGSWLFLLSCFLDITSTIDLSLLFCSLFRRCQTIWNLEYCKWSSSLLHSAIFQSWSDNSFKAIVLSIRPSPLQCQLIILGLSDSLMDLWTYESLLCSLVCSLRPLLRSTGCCMFPLRTNWIQGSHKKGIVDRCTWGI